MSVNFPDSRNSDGLQAFETLCEEHDRSSTFIKELKDTLENEYSKTSPHPDRIAHLQEELAETQSKFDAHLERGTKEDQLKAEISRETTPCP